MSSTVASEWRSDARHVRPEPNELSGAGGFPSLEGRGRGEGDGFAGEEDGGGLHRAERGAPAASLSPEGTIPTEDSALSLLREREKEKLKERGQEIRGGRAFEIEVCAAVAKHGAERVGLWTSTPGQVNLLGEFEKVYDWREASRRWDSLNSGVIRRRRSWQQWAMVMQRHKDGGIHFHVCVVHRQNIRGDLDFVALKNRDYRSANKILRAEWALWRKVAPRYGFGRVEFLPVYEPNGLGRYLARYLRREIGTRRNEDARAQLFRFSRSWQRAIVGEACWADVRAQRARLRATEAGRRLWGSQDTMIGELGPRWKWKLRRLLWCSERAYQFVIWEAEQSLESYGGALLCIDEAFAVIDRLGD